jgi:hypothetical protein
MENTLLDSETLSTITLLAKQLHLSETEILKRAVYDYLQKNQKRHRLLSFARMLTETEANDLLNVIQQNRYNKDFSQEV